MIPKVLIATAYWPSKTKFFEAYSIGICDLLKTEKADMEFFITTAFHEAKYGSNFMALKQAEKWAVRNHFDYMLIIDADIVISRVDFERMLDADKDVLLVGRGGGEGLCLFNLENEVCGGIGWGCSLIKTDVLKREPLCYTGDYNSPDRMWFKKIMHSGIKIWCLFDVVPNILEESCKYPTFAF